MEQPASEEKYSTLVPQIKCAHAARIDPKLLKPHPLNPNDHPPEQIDLFIEILKYQGWRRSITVSNQSGYITKGHGAREAALKAGFTPVPVDFQDYEDESQELADIVADNALARMAKINSGKLTEIVANLASFDGFEMRMTAIETKTLNTMMATLPGASQPAADNSLAIADLPDDTYSESSEASGPVYQTEEIREAGAINEPHHDDVVKKPKPVETSQVRIIQLQFTQETVVEFVNLVEFFQKQLNIDNVSDTVLTVLRLAKDSASE